MISTILRTALERRRLRATLSKISSDTGIDTASLSRFQSGERKGLRCKNIDKLSRYLGVALVHPVGVPDKPEDVTDAIRSALSRFPGSIRQVSHHTGIDAGNLSRFLHGQRSGLSIDSIDRLTSYFKLESTWQGTLMVEVFYRPVRDQWRRAACRGVPIACTLQKHGEIIDHSVTDSSGRVSLNRIVVGSTVYIYVDDILVEEIEMMEDYQEFTLLAASGCRPWIF